MTAEQREQKTIDAIHDAAARGVQVRDYFWYDAGVVWCDWQTGKFGGYEDMRLALITN